MASTTRKLPKRWTEEEDSVLHREVMKHSGEGYIKDWSRIADHLPGRSNKDCRKRWVNNVCGGLNKGSWKKDEDQRLLTAISAHGQRWTRVASEVASRSADQCAKRWQQSLDPKIKHGNWTSEEDARLIQSVEKYGRQWEMIQKKYYSSRSRNDLKNRHTILTRKANNLENACSPSMSSTCESAESASSPTSPAAMDTMLQNYPINDDMELDHHSANDQLDLSFFLDFMPEGGGLDQASSHHTSNTFALTDLHEDSFMQLSSHPSQTNSKTSDGMMPWMLTPDHFQGPQDLHPLSIGSGNSLGYTNPLLIEARGAGTSGEATYLQEQVGLAENHEIFTLPRDESTVADETNPTHQVMRLDEEGGTTASISLRIRDCDRETLKYLLDVTQPIKGKVRMEIDM